MVKPWRDDLFEIDHLQKEAERYRSDACHGLTDQL